LFVFAIYLFCFFLWSLLMTATLQPIARPVLRLEDRQAAGRHIRYSERLAALTVPTSRLPAIEQPPSQLVQLAARSEELFAAFSLVYKAYLKTGLVRPNPYQMRVTPYHLLSTTDVIVAHSSWRKEVVCTLSLVGDGDLGLPIETAFAEEVAERRRRGIYLAEVTSLADQRDGDQGGTSPLLTAMGFMAQRAKHRGIDELLITVHPHHVKFYQRFIGFELLGEERPYEAVLDKPAVALVLDLNRLHVNHPRAYQRFFGQPFSECALSDQPLSKSVRAKLRKIVAVCNATQYQPEALDKTA
jgi:hypothetical protein